MTEDAETEPDTGDGRKAGGWVILLLVLAVVLGGAWYLNGKHEESEQRELGDSIAAIGAIGASGCQEVRYYVGGTATSASITMERPTGTEQVTVDVPMRNKAGEEGLVAGCFDPGAFTYISAQNEGERGTITCRIERDGIQVSQAESNGAYAIATCSD